MSLLAQISKGATKRPHFILLYGVDGVGKSTFGAEAPNPVFIGNDDGLDTIDAASFPAMKDWPMVKSAVSELLNGDHPYKTAVFDTVNGLEVLLWNYIIKEDRVSSIEEVGGGFGKGYVLAAEHWAQFLNDLKRLRQKMNVILLGHAQIKSFEDPHQNERFDRFQLKMHEKSAALIREAVSTVLFANFKTSTRKEKGAKKAKAYGDGARVMFTERRPAFDAKNRFDLPFEMELSWLEFAKMADAAKPASAATEDKVAKLFEGREDKAIAYLVSIDWLLEGQTLADLLEKRRKPILNRSDDFLRAVDEFASKATEEETTTPETSESA